MLDIEDKEISHPGQGINSLSHSRITGERREIKAFCHLSGADLSRIMHWVGLNHFFPSIAHPWHKIEPDAKMPFWIVFESSACSPEVCS